MLPIARDRTVALIRHLRAIELIRGPRPRRRIGRLPRQLQPDGIRSEYFRAIRYVVDDAATAVQRVEHAIVALLDQDRRERGRHDAPPPGGGSQAKGGPRRFEVSRRKARAVEMIDSAAKAFTDGYSPTAIQDVAREFAQRTSKFSKDQLGKQVRAAMGVNLATIETPIVDLIDGFAATNVDLITTVPGRYFDRLRLDVEAAFEAGSHPETLAREFAETYGIGLDDARRIARDQIGKLNGQVNQARQESMGVTGYIWRTVRDARVRDNHDDLDGERFTWDDPPLGGGTSEDEEGHPGEGIQCRCYAEPDLTDLVGDLDAGADED